MFVIHMPLLAFTIIVRTALVIDVGTTWTISADFAAKNWYISGFQEKKNWVVMGLGRVLRKPVPRLLSSPKALDISAASPLVSSTSSMSDANALELSDRIRSIRRDRKWSLRLKESDSMSDVSASASAAVDRFCELVPEMEPVLVARVVSDMSTMLESEVYGKECFARVMNAVVDRLETLELGCLARILFCIATRDRHLILSDDLRDRIYIASIRRVGGLLRYDRVPPKVVSKLCVGFSLLEGEVRAREDAFIWEELKRLALREVENFEACQVQQVAFGFSRIIERSPLGQELITKLTKRGLDLSPVANMSTYMNLLVSLSRIQRLKIEEWEMFKRVVRDHLGGLREGFIPLPELRRRTGLSDLVTLRRVRHSLKI